GHDEQAAQIGEIRPGPRIPPGQPVDQSAIILILTADHETENAALRQRLIARRSSESLGGLNADALRQKAIELSAPTEFLVLGGEFLRNGRQMLDGFRVFEAALPQCGRPFGFKQIRPRLEKMALQRWG